uniref:CG5993 n=1 Tax=Macrostomum lignano TaxID=282301 RepID=A0A1I8IZA5_9PLAT
YFSNTLDSSSNQADQPVAQPKLWERPWTLDEIRERAHEWSLAGDAGDSVQEIRSSRTLLHNTFNDFNALADTRFVENSTTKRLSNNRGATLTPMSLKMPKGSFLLQPPQRPLRRQAKIRAKQLEDERNDLDSESSRRNGEQHRGSVRAAAEAAEDRLMKMTKKKKIMKQQRRSQSRSTNHQQSDSDEDDLQESEDRLTSLRRDNKKPKQKQTLQQAAATKSTAAAKSNDNNSVASLRR